MRLAARRHCQSADSCARQAGRPGRPAPADAGADTGERPPGHAAADASFIAAGGYLPSVNKLFGCMESIDDRAQGTAISVVEIATSGLPVHRATLGLGDSIKIFRRV